MKILHVLYSGLGGHGNVLFSLIDADEKKAYTYEVLFNGIEEVRNEYVRRCNIMQVPWNFVKKTKGLDVKYYYRLFLDLRRGSADIIFLHSSAYILPAKLAKFFSRMKPQIIVRETQANHLKSKAEWFWLGVSLMFADKVVFLSEEYKSVIANRMPWIFSSPKTEVIPNGIDLKKFYPEVNKCLGNIITIGMQSRLVQIKDHLTLFKAIAWMKNAAIGKTIVLKVAGEGDYQSILRESVRDLKLEDQVSFVGLLDEPDLVEFMQSLDIYIHASLGETMSTAIMQAMACRLPIIASDVDGINNMIIHNQTGILVPVKDYLAMAKAIKMIMEDQVLSNSLSTAAFNFAIKYYSNSVMFQKYTRIFEKAPLGESNI